MVQQDDATCEACCGVEKVYVHEVAIRCVPALQFVTYPKCHTYTPPPFVFSLPSLALPRSFSLALALSLLFLLSLSLSVCFALTLALSFVRALSLVRERGDKKRKENEINLAHIVRLRRGNKQRPCDRVDMLVSRPQRRDVVLRRERRQDLPRLLKPQLGWALRCRHAGQAAAFPGRRHRRKSQAGHCKF